MPTPGIAVYTDNSKSYWLGTAGDDSFVGLNNSEQFAPGIGDDVVYASGGSDIIYADLGDDWFDGGQGNDTINFYGVGYSPTGGSVSPFGIKFDLAKSTQDLGYFGVKTVYGIENVDGTVQDDQIWGNAESNIIVGYGGDDRIEGRAGNDTLGGSDGNDTLIGGDGDDLLEGSTGADRMFSGLGADELRGFAGQLLSDDGFRDSFIYSSIKYSGTTDATRDTIYGFFEGANGDRIDLSAIDANGSRSGDGKFTFIGSNSFKSNSTSEVQVKATGNANEYMVKIDIDNDNGSEMQILVHSTSVLTASDFIL